MSVQHGPRGVEPPPAPLQRRQHRRAALEGRDAVRRVEDERVRVSGAVLLEL